MNFTGIAIIGIALLAALSSTRAHPQGRIAGGEDAVVGQLPYQAALSVGGSYNCGAAIISERYALTALTCVCSSGSDRPWPATLFMVSGGSVDLYSGGQRIRVEEIKINPNYYTLNTGIALLRLSEPFVFNADVSALPMAVANPPLGSTVEISGWGRTTEAEENMHRFLQIGDAQVVADRECNLARDEQVPVDNDQVLCLGHQWRQGICGGDLGGPAVYEGTLVGLGAQLLGECGSLLPVRFISIASNYEWIKAQIE